MKENKLKILYVGNFCSEKEYALMFKNASFFASQQSQKFNRLVAEGLALNNCDVDVLSGRIVSPENKQKFFKAKNECENGVNYNYLSFPNIKVLRNLALMNGAKKFAKKWCKQNPNGVMICDILNVSVVSGAIKVFKKRGMQVVGIITDLPEDLSTGKNNLFVKKAGNLIKECNKYVILAEPMARELKIDNKPFEIIEGICDSKIKETKKILENKKNILLYTGVIDKRIWIDILVEAFICLQNENWKLQICGTGDFENELKEICKTNKNIEYLGSVPNKKAVELQRNAKLLVNPRPTNERFVKFSFPSKNIEYMASGTPVLTTCLPSMPKEYYKHVYLLKNESVEGYKNTLNEVFSLTDKELEIKGQEAQNFVLQNKNNKAQTKKIIDMINKM